jgi:hypothetical protein
MIISFIKPVCSVKDKHILESEDFITVWQDDKKLNSLK